MPAKNENGKVVKTKRAPGRPPIGDKSMKLHRVYLTEEQHQKALAVGDGVYGEGIRTMIDAYTLPKKHGKPTED